MAVALSAPAASELEAEAKSPSLAQPLVGSTEVYDQFIVKFRGATPPAEVAAHSRLRTLGAPTGSGAA